MRTTVVALACAALFIGACAPPEPQRVQGGGRGADIGNRSPVVQMHEGSEIYPDERCAIQGAECTGPLPRSGREAEFRR
jgi:hypothetical protein